MVLCQGDLVLHNYLLHWKVRLLYSKMEFQQMWYNYSYLDFTKAFDSEPHKRFLVLCTSSLYYHKVNC